MKIGNGAADAALLRSESAYVKRHAAQRYSPEYISWCVHGRQNKSVLSIIWYIGTLAFSSPGPPAGAEPWRAPQDIDGRSLAPPLGWRTHQHVEREGLVVGHAVVQGCRGGLSRSRVCRQASSTGAVAGSGRATHTRTCQSFRRSHVTAMRV